VARLSTEIAVSPISNLSSAFGYLPFEAQGFGGEYPGGLFRGETEGVLGLSFKNRKDPADPIPSWVPNPPSG